MRWLDSLFERHKGARRIVLGICMWIVWDSFSWAMAFANSSPRSGQEIALILAAVLTPVSAMMTAVFAFSASAEKPEEPGLSAGV